MVRLLFNVTVQLPVDVLSHPVHPERWLLPSMAGAASPTIVPAGSDKVKLVVP